MIMYTPIMILTGSILNLLTIIVFMRKRMRKYCFSLSMICLAISDTSVLSIPVLLTWIDDVFFKYYFLNNTIWCNLHAYLDLVFCANSSWIIILISTERWFAVYKPWQKSKVFTNSRVAYTLLSLFLLAIVIFISIPLSMHIVEKDNKFECIIISEQAYYIIGILSILLVYVIPFIILAILNAMIINRLRIRPFSLSYQQNRSFTVSSKCSLKRKRHSSKQPMEIMEQADEMASLKKNQTIYKKSISNVQYNNTKNDRNLSITLVTVAITFMILTFPFQGYWFYEQFYLKSTKNTTLPQLSAGHFDFNATNSTQKSHESSKINFREITFIIKNMNYVINFFLYSALSKLFRREFFALFTLILNLKRNACSCNEGSHKSLEYEFSIKPFVRDSSKRSVLKIRIESSSLNKYLNSKSSKIDKSEQNENRLKSTINTHYSDPLFTNKFERSSSKRQIINNEECTAVSLNKVSSATQTPKNFKRYLKKIDQHTF